MTENLLWGNLGQLCLVAVFVFSLFAFIAYAFTWRDKKSKVGDILFSVSAVATLLAFICLFVILKDHLYEYKYAYEHSNNAMSPKFLLSAIWEGQEGSFLLWMSWNSLIGLILLRHRSVLKNGIMMVLSIFQFFLSTMLVGWIFGDFALGSTPFILFKDAFPNLPFIANNPDTYLQFLRDGTGLNPLLQNYWMVIHPPVLFLGFASSIVPFAFAISGMLHGQYTLWNNLAMPWATFAAGILGLGILMGGAWAYESLSFGGYWAWDPVENASLVPWLTLVAGLHTMIIYRATGRSMRLNILFFILSFILVLYSTYLTRSGVLGETSVHAFTDLGMNEQLILLFSFFGLAAVIMYIRHYRRIPHIASEEAIYSREFWMFISALLLALSALHITFFTSVPVWNKLFGLNIAPPINVVAFYNKFHIWISILLLILSAGTLYLHFKNTNSHKFWRSLIVPATISVLLSLIICLAQKISEFPFILMTLAASFGIVANLYYLAKYNKWQVRKGAAAFTHWGFAILLLGVLISSYNKTVISKNTAGIDLNMGAETEEENLRENAVNLLLLRQVPSQMNEYLLTYIKDSLATPNHYYEILFEKFDADMKLKEKFTLQPNVQFNPQMGGIISNPDTRHYLTKDVYTYITKAVDKSEKKDSMDTHREEMAVGDTMYFSNGMSVLQDMYRVAEPHLGLKARLAIYTLSGDSFTSQPAYYLQGDSTVAHAADTVADLDLYVEIQKVMVSENKLQIEFRQPSIKSDFVVIKSILFPYVNLVWLGSILMTLGFALSTIKRIRKSRA